MSATRAATTEPELPRRSAWRSPWLWLGVAISALNLWWAFHDQNLAEVGRHIVRANWWAIALVAVPAHVIANWIRALRWRHLTDPIAKIEVAALFRATAVMFMGNNLFPLRAGEVLRAWYLAREVQVSATSLLATILLERVIDAIAVVLLAVGLAFSMHVRSGPSTEALWLGVPALLLAAVLPLAFMVMLRRAPETTVRLARRTCEVVLRGWLADEVEGLLRKFSSGLGAIRGGVHLAWVTAHTVILWGVFSVLPFVVVLWAMDIAPGGIGRTIEAGYSTLVWVGLAVSLPSAPGFFGLFQTASRVALAPFGVPTDAAVALGTVANVTYWVTTTALGLVSLRFGRTSFDAVSRAAGSAGGQVDPADRR